MAQVPCDRTKIIHFVSISSLTKEVSVRPKYPELLESVFLKKYEMADIDVAAWFASVMESITESNR